MISNLRKFQNVNILSQIQNQLLISAVITWLGITEIIHLSSICIGSVPERAVTIVVSSDGSLHSSEQVNRFSIGLLIDSVTVEKGIGTDIENVHEQGGNDPSDEEHNLEELKNFVRGLGNLRQVERRFQRSHQSTEPSIEASSFR